MLRREKAPWRHALIIEWDPMPLMIPVARLTAARKPGSLEAGIIGIPGTASIGIRVSTTIRTRVLLSRQTGEGTLDDTPNNGLQETATGAAAAALLGPCTGRGGGGFWDRVEDFAGVGSWGIGDPTGRDARGSG